MITQKLIRLLFRHPIPISTRSLTSITTSSPSPIHASGEDWKKKGIKGWKIGKNQTQIKHKGKKKKVYQQGERNDKRTFEQMIEDNDIRLASRTFYDEKEGQHAVEARHIDMMMNEACYTSEQQWEFIHEIMAYRKAQTVDVKGIGKVIAPTKTTSCFKVKIINKFHTFGTTTIGSNGYMLDTKLMNNYIHKLRIEGDETEATRVATVEMKKFQLKSNKDTELALQIPTNTLSKQRTALLTKLFKQGGRDATAASWDVSIQSDAVIKCSCNYR